MDVKAIRERSKRRRKLLAKELGIESVDALAYLVHSRADLKERKGYMESLKEYQKSTTAKRYAFEVYTAVEKAIESQEDRVATTRDEKETKKEGEKEMKKEGGAEDRGNEEDEEVQEIYKGSSTFLKGTQSANPHNDYSQHYVDTGQRPQNFIRDAGIQDRFEEYPKLKELIRLKEKHLQERATPPMYLKCDLEAFDLKSIDVKFDVIYVNPPLEEYHRRASGVVVNQKPWQWEDVLKLEVENIGSPRSFVFIWCGAAEGLDWGRKCLRKWGYRRCEDICWIKTNFKNPGHITYLEPNSVMQHCKEHCLMGIKGTVRRSVDTDFIHSNVDIDLVITEDFPIGSTEKPTELFNIMEHFCLGRRRLHLFGDDAAIRPGWLTLGPDLSSSNYSHDAYKSYFEKPEDAVLGYQNEIEMLRPKSPVPKGKGGRPPPPPPPISNVGPPQVGSGQPGPIAPGDYSYAGAPMGNYAPGYHPM
ncbi:N6-adenosine-methyltransferase non-catalytic subunit-like [Oscarella lobularis]|uniref:N6-adenosine-methyltransferase non-catalytic subunit-like n=1 Tax=Oscarella lobularis TaxID=121494 RepID=UPI0033139565